MPNNTPISIEDFNPNDHLIQIKNKGKESDYLEVKWRLVWFRRECPLGTIHTEIVLLDPDKEVKSENFVWNNDTRRSEKVVTRGNGLAVVRAVVTDGKGGEATAIKMENAAAFPDYAEKAETGSVGRALAMLGYGTQFTGFELDEGVRIVDAPVTRTADATVESRKPATDYKPAVAAPPKSNGTYKAPTPAQVGKLVELGVAEAVAGKLNAYVASNTKTATNKFGSSQVSDVLSALIAGRSGNAEKYDANPARFVEEALKHSAPELLEAAGFSDVDPD